LFTLDVKKSNSSNETPNVMTVGVEKYGLSVAVLNGRGTGGTESEGRILSRIFSGKKQ
jgi:hypothetical protein